MRDTKIARLREPLGIILGWVELLRRGRLPGERAAFALEAIARNARLQAELLEELARAGAGGRAAPIALRKAKSRLPPLSASSLRKLGR